MNLKNEIALTLLLLAGMGMLLALVASPVDLSRETEKVQHQDGEILAHCMNGHRISLGDGQVMHCEIQRVRT